MGVTGIILAGGKSKRLGRNKSLEKINGTTILEKVIKTLIPITDALIISTANENVPFPLTRPQ